MALFTEHAGRERNPLGGREADGFDQWLTVTAQVTREARDDLRENLSPRHPMRYVAAGAARDYDNALSAWSHVKVAQHRSKEDADRVRDVFETGLIAGVMIAYGAAQYARECGYGPNDRTSGGRPVADIAAEYLRACFILAKYVGVDDGAVAACRDDQSALVALRNTQG